MMQDRWRSRGTAHVFGHDLSHDGDIMDFQFVKARVTEPTALIPHLFANSRPGIVPSLKAGDFIVAGRNFGCGKAHTPGYIALCALGLRVLCESAPSAVERAMVTLALPAMTHCTDITLFVRDGDEIEADFKTGAVTNHTTGKTRHYPGLSDSIAWMLERGGLIGALKQHLIDHPELAIAP
jgi:3-isopropylmalate/(R)-2-methylmalate dehydratase small subunit